ncbi:MAG: hypothetical protein K5694_01230 [Bacilli bacterium]|nr:hypothetical protein [Bacilli bacterium]
MATKIVANDGNIPEILEMPGDPSFSDPTWNDNYGEEIYKSPDQSDASYVHFSKKTKKKMLLSKFVLTFTAFLNSFQGATSKIENFKMKYQEETSISAVISCSLVCAYTRNTKGFVIFYQGERKETKEFYCDWSAAVPITSGRKRMEVAESFFVEPGYYQLQVKTDFGFGLTLQINKIEEYKYGR